jgi:starch phosphorylase
VGHTSSAPSEVRTGLEVQALTAALAEHLRYQQAIPPSEATRHDWYMALALACRDRLLDRYMTTIDTVLQSRAKVVAYFSAEYLTGRG